MLWCIHYSTHMPQMDKSFLELCLSDMGMRQLGHAPNTFVTLYVGRDLKPACHCSYSFSAATDTPAYVFPRNLGPNVPKNIWEAVSHEGKGLK